MIVASCDTSLDFLVRNAQMHPPCGLASKGRDGRAPHSREGSAAGKARLFPSNPRNSLFAHLVTGLMPAGLDVLVR